MGKKKKIYKNISELKESRDGGQIALSGYSYQFLYSCYLILFSSSENTIFNLEGIEDIDKIEVKNNGEIITYTVEVFYNKAKC